MGSLRVISGQWRGRRLNAGRDSTALRPTADRVRTALFDRLMPLIPGGRVLDLFAGTGALGIEALSRGAAHVTFVERSAPSLRLIAENLASVGAGSVADVRREEVGRMIGVMGRLGDRFDLVLADPPYGQGLAAETVRWIDQAGVVAAGGVLVVEHDRREEMPSVGATIAHDDDRRFGDTILTFYRGLTDEDRALSRDI